MSRHTKRWARLARQRLIAELGGTCYYCQRTSALEFHVKEAGHPHHGLSTDARMSFYRRMASAGLVCLLCRKCHQALHRRANTYGYTSKPVH